MFNTLIKRTPLLSALFLTLSFIDNSVAAACSNCNDERERSLVTVGTYFTTDIFDDPLFTVLIMRSTNEGSTWKLIEKNNISLPLEIDGLTSKRHSLNSVSCKGDLCIAVGGTWISLLDPFSLILYSTNGGTSWEYVLPKNIVMPNDFLFVNKLNSVSCNEFFCTAIGLYVNTNYYNVPFILVSKNNGFSWEAVNADNILGAPKNRYLHLLFQFNSVKCMDSSCIGVGEYQDDNYLNHPFLIRTEDGITWSTITEDKISMPSDFVQQWPMEVTSSTCNGFLCLSVGMYITSTSDLPLILRSTNTGNSWVGIEHEKIKMPIDSSSAYYVAKELFSVACSKSNCTAVGVYFNGGLVPLILNSTDNGESWEAVEQENIHLPSDYNADTTIGNSLVGVSCYEMSCTATGSYFTTAFEILPLILNSNDAGLTWIAVEKSEFPGDTGYTLPSDFVHYAWISGMSNSNLNAGYFMTPINTSKNIAQ